LQCLRARRLRYFFLQPRLARRYHFAAFAVIVISPLAFLRHFERVVCLPSVSSFAPLVSTLIVAAFLDVATNMFSSRAREAAATPPRR